MQPDTHRRPTTVRLARDGAAVTLEWADRTARVTASTLRGACRCAWCTKARRLGESVGSADAITAFEPMGGEAVHIVFSDGHRTGVFPWDFLSELATTETTTTEATP
jgi:DUF971 family protein